MKPHTTTTPIRFLQLENQVRFALVSELGLRGLDRLRVTLRITDGWTTITQKLDLYDLDQKDRLLRLLVSAFRMNPGTLRQTLKQLIESLEAIRLQQIELKQTA